MTPDDARRTSFYNEIVALFGDEADTRVWLSTLLPALGRTPLACLATQKGAAEVRILLRQLSYGIYS